MAKLEADKSITMSQPRQISKIQPVRQSPDEYIAQRARGAYIATVSQPERAFGFSLLRKSPENQQRNKLISSTNS